MVVRGLGWLTGAQGARQALQLVVRVLMVRMLSPDDFGRLAMVTVVAGFLLMHKGASMAMSKESKPFSWRGFAIDIGVSLAYTVFIIALIKLKWVTPPEGLLRR